MKRIISICLIQMFVIQIFIMTAYGKPEWPSSMGVMAEGGVVIDMDSGAMLYGQNSHSQYYPASITKLLTAYVVLEKVASLDEMVTFSEDAIYNVEAGSSNPLDIQPGEQMSVEDCLYLLLLRSSNPAANALAEHVAGSRDGFVDMMNETIEELGCKDSHFKNPSGLNDPEQVVSPYDMAFIAKAAFSEPKLLEIASSTSHKFPPTVNYPNGPTVNMEHKLLVTDNSESQFYFPDAVAGKTGYTSLAGNTLVTLAERNGRRVIAVVLKGTQPQYYLDSKELLEFGLSQFYNVSIQEKEVSYVSGEMPIAVGDKTYQPSELEFSEGSMITLPNDAVYEDAEKSLETELPENAPERAVAMLSYTYNERRIGQAYLCLKEATVLVDSPATKVQTVDKETAESREETETGSPEEKGDFPASSLWLGIGAVAVIAALVGIVGYFVYMQRRERKAMELRRERRRKRREEDGFSEEEFKRLLAERLEKGKKS